MLNYGYPFNVNIKILIFQPSGHKNKIVFRINLNQRGYHVDRRSDVISTYINVESTLIVCWDITEIEKHR